MSKEQKHSGWIWLGVAALAAAGGAAALYAGRRRLLAARLGLPQPTCRVIVERNLRVPVAPDVTLAADLYRPVGPDPAASQGPVVLIRTPYGRQDILSTFAAQRFAERGYFVLVEDVRGQFDSDGFFEPLRYEAEDGAATLDWLTDQAWCNGRIGMWGPSYLGYVQWAAARAGNPALRALVPVVTGSQFKSLMLPDGSVALDLIFRWSLIMQLLAESRGPLDVLRNLSPGRLDQLLAEAFAHLPLEEAVDQIPLSLWPQYRPRPALLDTDDTFWQTVDHRPATTQATLPVHLIGGWYDLFSREILADYRRLRDAGAPVQLTMGPWAHTDLGPLSTSLSAALTLFATALVADRVPQPLAQPVRIYVMGAERWRAFADWPPPARPQRLYLQPKGGLGAAPAAAGAPATRYRYDPADATPSVGGPLLIGASGARDNRGVEQRPDVVVFTSPVLSSPLEVVGSVSATLYVQTTAVSADFVARLCVVKADGRSINLCEGLVRLPPHAAKGSGELRVEIDLGATAYAFQSRERIRLQVASAMHPRYARNLGTGEPVATGRSLMPAEQTVFHDAARPSSLLLSVFEDA